MSGVLGRKQTRWHRVRLAAFTTLFLWMAFSPIRGQVFGDQSLPFHSWTMFSSVGLGVVAATFSERLPNGRERPIDRFSLLGYESRRTAPRAFRHISGTAGVYKVARRLCDALGPEADVRVRSRVATRDGWRPGYTGESNVCTLAPPEADDEEDTSR